MDNKMFDYRRKSYIEIGEIYFWTATIHQWRKLLLQDSYKNIVVNSLKYLSNAGMVDVFAFVIMPNHIHLIWRMNMMTGKETPATAFLKYTAHEFKGVLKVSDSGTLAEYAVSARNKAYEFWQRDSLAVHLYTEDVAFQKLDYLHSNPLAEHWQLANDPCEYEYSSARFYEMGESRFLFLRDLREAF